MQNGVWVKNLKPLRRAHSSFIETHKKGPCKEGSIVDKDEQEGSVEISKGFPGESEELYKDCEGESGEGASVLLQRPPQQEARYACPLDPADQRRNSPTRSALLDLFPPFYWVLALFCLKNYDSFLDLFWNGLFDLVGGFFVWGWDGVFWVDGWYGFEENFCEEYFFLECNFPYLWDIARMWEWMDSGKKVCDSEHEGRWNRKTAFCAVWICVVPLRKIIDFVICIRIILALITWYSPRNAMPSMNFFIVVNWIHVDDILLTGICRWGCWSCVGK